MTWLKKRLKELGMTHQDLTDTLHHLGIEKSRPTVSNWVNGHPIPLLMSPEETSVLAMALEWSVTEMLISAGYKLQVAEVPPEIALYLPQINKLTTQKEKETFRDTIEFGLNLIAKGFLNSTSDGADRSQDRHKSDDDSDTRTSPQA
jgi:hypothetical protein